MLYFLIAGLLKKLHIALALYRNVCHSATVFNGENTMVDPKGKFVNVRVDDTLHQAFLAKAARFGGKSEVMRELIEAFLEDRLTIQPPVTPRKESLYVTRSKD